MPQQMQRQSPQQRNPNQKKLIDDSPDSYQVSDKYVDRDINISDNNNDLNEYTYEYISESNSYYKRNLPRILALQRQQQLQQNSPASNLENDSEYTYVYDYPSSELEDQSVPRNGFENRNNNKTPNNYNYSNRNVPPNAFQYNNNNTNDDSEYTYTYDSVNSFNDQYQNLPQNQRPPPQQRSIKAKLIPQGMRNQGAPLIPAQMNIQTPDESTNDYTYTYDEPTTEEKMLIESMKNRDIPLPSPNQNVNNFSISNIPQVEIPPAEIPPAKPKKKPTSNKNKKNNHRQKLSPREKKIQQKISKLQKNLNKLENVSDDEEEETADINDNKKVNLLKNKIADLTGWRNSPQNGQIGSYGTNSYTYTFEYESEVFPQKKEPAELCLVSPIGSVSIEAVKQPPQTVVERNFLVNDEPAKINLEISPAVQSESSHMNAASKQQKKAEQLQEIFELKKKLQQLQQQMNYNEDDDNENFSYEPQSSSSTADNQDQDQAASGEHNRIRVKKRVRVPKQVKLSNDLKQQQQQGDVKKLKKVQKRVRVEKNTSHHHHHHSHRGNRQADNSQSHPQPQIQLQQKDDRELDEEFVTKDVLLEEDSEGYESQNQSQNESEAAASTASTYRNSATSEALQLLDESSSPHSSTVMPQFTSPKSPLRLLDEGSDDDDEEANQQSLKVKVVEVENMPDVSCFCVAFIDSTGDARKTSVASRGSPKEFDDVLSFPLRDVDEGEVNNLVVLVKRHDLIKNDRLLGTAKVEIDLQSLRNGDEIEKRVQLLSDAGIPTQSQVHIIMSLHDITATSEDAKNTSPQTVEFVTMPIQEAVTREVSSPRTTDLNTRSVHFTSEEEEDIYEGQQQPQPQLHQKPQSRLHHSDEDNEEEEDDQEPLNPSNVKLSNDMKNRLKIHRNFNALEMNDESGVFILEAPSKSPLDAEFDQNPSSSFITDLVRQQSIDNESKNSRSSNSSSKAKNRSNVNFSKGDKITYNLENDVRLNQRAQQRGAGVRDLEADEASESGGNRDQIKKKRRTIQKIEPTSRDGQINKEPIQIEIDFASNSNSFPDYYSGVSAEIDG